MLTNNLRSYLQRLENDIYINVDNCISKFCDFFMNASTMMKKSPKGNKSLKQNQYNSKTFFDKECYEQKLILRKCLRKYKRKNNNELNIQSVSKNINHSLKIKRKYLTNQKSHTY